MPLNEVEPIACDAAQRSWESTPILYGEQPEAVEDSVVALNCLVREGHTGYWTK